MTDEQPLLVDTKKAARLLSISERTLHELKKQRKIPFVLIGRSVRYAVKDLESWLKTQTQRPQNT